MNPATKLALAFIVVTLAGFTLVAIGSGAFRTGVGQIISGLCLIFIGASMFGAVWKNR